MNKNVHSDAALMLLHVPGKLHFATEAIWMLDVQMAHIVRTTTEPMIGRIRLCWWRDALEALATSTAPNEPLLQRLQGAGIATAPLAEMADAWTNLLEPMPIPDPVLMRYADGRGRILFDALADILGGQNAAYVSEAGRAWALVDFAKRCSDVDTAKRAMDMGRALLIPALKLRWPAPLRPLGMTAHMALLDMQHRRNPVYRYFRVIYHKISGY